MHIKKLIPCASSAFKAYAYDPAAQTLYLQFTTGNTYAYPEFSTDHFAAFDKAESKGRYYGEHIRGKFSPQPVHLETDDLAKDEATVEP